MSRRDVMDLFEKQKERTEERINAGIEQYRKGYADIKIVDGEGNAIPNARVTVRQKTHEFRFGANIFMLDELETAEKNEKYKKYFADVFNIATLPFYWDSTEPEKGKTRYEKGSEPLYRRPPIDHCIEFCEKHGIEPREHALAYEYFFPKWLEGASVFEIKTAMEQRYKEISERYAKKIRTIEVFNEMDHKQGHTAIYDEPDFIEYSFKLAEKYFPANQIAINEGPELSFLDKGRTTDKYYANILANIQKGVRIDAIGMQYHLFYWPRETEYEKTRKTLNPDWIYHQLDLYSNFGKPLQITEITVPAYSHDSEDEQIQAEILEWLYSIWFSHPNMEQIIYWNIVDGYAWVKDQSMIKGSHGNMTLGENRYYGGLLRFDLSPKPAYYAVNNLINKKWRTNTELCTDSNGEASLKGFYGDYEAVICVNGTETVKTFSLKKKGERNITLIVE